MAGTTGKKRQNRRRKPVQDRSSATVDALLEATAQILLSHGYERASTNEIARRAGVSVGSLYQYFDNKDALVAELARRHFGRIESVVHEHLVPVSGGPPDMRAMIARVLRALVAVHRHNPRLSQVLDAEVPRVGELRIIEEMGRRSELLVAERLVAARSLLRPTNLVLAAQLVVRAVSGIIQGTLRRSGGGDLPHDLEDELVELVLRYLLRDPGPPAD
jgi:AcrR family transcriptional regulator